MSSFVAVAQRQLDKKWRCLLRFLASVLPRSAIVAIVRRVYRRYSCRVNPAGECPGVRFSCAFLHRKLENFPSTECDRAPF